ncbi:MAG: hypothetical protein V1660_02785 [archaeon]
MNKILALAMLSMVAIMPMAAAWGYYPDAFDFIHVPSMDCSNCGTGVPQTTCGQYQCILAMCNAAIAPSTTLCEPDTNPCTVDACDGNGGCAHTDAANGAVCTSGGNAGTCMLGNCYVAQGACNDGNACTIDSPPALTGPGSFGCQEIPGAPESFTHSHTAITCNDNDPDTTDTCDTQTGCVYTMIPPIDDGDNGSDVPEFSAIAAGVALIGSAIGFAVMRRRR